MKIKSITNVITNSSDETYLVRTTATLEEVNKWLSENIEGVCPAYLVKDSCDLQDWLDFEGLYDPSDPKSVLEYQIRAIGYFISSWHTKHGTLRFAKAWVRFINNHLKEFDLKEPVYLLHCRFRRRGFSYVELINYWFFEVSEGMTPELMNQFIKHYKGKHPNWNIPEELTVQHWIGAYKIDSECENSIPWRDMDKLWDKFSPNIKRCHLG